MFSYAWLKKLSYKKFLAIVLISYFLMILLFLVNLHVIESRSDVHKSFSLNFPHKTPKARRDSLTGTSDMISDADRHTFSKIQFFRKSLKDIMFHESYLKPSENSKTEVKSLQPTSLLGPMVDVGVRGESTADFLAIGEMTYVYSAFLDDRKVPSYVRVITLVSERVSHLFIYCHFNEITDAEPQKSEHYEMCENHQQPYRGYIYSCRVPHTVNVKELKFVTVSFNTSKAIMPVLQVRPPEHRISFLDLYPQISNVKESIQLENEYKYEPLIKGISTNSPNSNITKDLHSLASLSFAICVSPLFGNISVHRLVEFVELSRLLGADYFVFYNHSVTLEISQVLEYYSSKNMASVLPWTLPSKVNDNIWYYGQLLANNDCLYRTMPHFDLVSFNDIDEFIVPRSSASTWGEAFSSLLTEVRCGFSFQSAFYDTGFLTGFGQRFERTLLTPVLTSKSQMYSEIRTKVMLCPWRVFEVGIHHISKQNREMWHTLQVHPDVASLHHYRECLSSFGMVCDSWTIDTIIADRYLVNLTANYKAALRNIANFRKLRGV